MLFDLPAGACVPSRGWRRSLRAQNPGYSVPLPWLLAAKFPNAVIAGLLSDCIHGLKKFKKV